MRAHVRFVGLLMAIVLLVAVVAAAGPAVYIVTLDDYGNSYYFESTGSGTLEPQTVIGHVETTSNYGAGIGKFTNDEYYDFVVGTGYIGGPSKEIYLWKRTNAGNDFQGPDSVGLWSSGDYPADMPVASFYGKVFDPDGLDDFVMVGYGSQYVGVYKNTGNGAFEKSASDVANAAPLSSFGADAADINHDGYADVVVAPAGGDPQIFVNLGNGEGAFTPSSFPTYLSTPYMGITAADFDGDYKVDLIATTSVYDSNLNGFDFYKGDGLGGFTFVTRFGEGLLSASSPVDNYDLNGDGYQDLVASNINGNQFAVIVGLNNGLGGFTFSDPYAGSGSGSGLLTIAAPPVFQNEAPVAVVSFSAVSPGVLYDDNVIIAGTSIKFSSYDSTDVSYDPEGKELEYSWSFGDGNLPETGVDVTHKFNTPGSYGATLTLTDNYGATMEKTVTVYVNEPPTVVDDIYPTDINEPLIVVAAEGVLKNDVDDGYLKPLEVKLDTDPDSGPFSGNVVLNADGSFTYTPSEDFIGTDSFKYTANDGLEDSNVGMVTITVNSPAFETWDVNIVPCMINLKSKGLFIAFITLPEPYMAADVTEVVCEGATATRLIRHAKYPQAFGAIFRTSELEGIQVGKQEFTVTGTVMYEGLPYAFKGDDTVRVFTFKTKVRDETEGWESHGEKKLFDDHYKWNKNR